MSNLRLIKRSTIVFFVLTINFYFSICYSFGDINDPETLPFKPWDPHNRPKNGPVLNNVTHKVYIDWLKKWIGNPKGHDLKARMPNLRLNEDEIEAIIAYLASIADPDFPQIEFDEFLFRGEGEFDDEQYDKMNSLFTEGKTVFSASRCVICHRVKNEFGQVGVGPDLGMLYIKVNRNWLYQWIKRPQGYFPDTQMSQFRLDDEKLRGTVEFLMRDGQFRPDLEAYYGMTLDELDNKGIYELPGEKELIEKSQEEYARLKADNALVEKGKRIIIFSRCFVCHDIKGIDELLPAPKAIPEYTGEYAKFVNLLNEIRCLTCHRVREVGGHFAPDLSRAGSKLKDEWELDFLQRPNPIRPLLQQMPKFNLSEEEAKLAVEFIETVLTSDEVPNLKDLTPKEEGVTKGRELFSKKGCNTCHTVGDSGGVVGPNLNQAGKRLEPGYIMFHIKDPQRANPGAVEPNFGLTDDEALSITQFLMTLQD